MPNRGELVLRSAPSEGQPSDDDAVWTFVWICAAGWAISVYVAVISQAAELIPMLIAQSAMG
jgi:hypothetical protein